MSQKNSDKLKYGIKWKSIRERVFLIKGKFCQCCGKLQGDKIYTPIKIVRLTVHHQDGNKANHKLNNLMVLCQKCHMSEHHIKRVKLSLHVPESMPVDTLP